MGRVVVHGQEAGLGRGPFDWVCRRPVVANLTALEGRYENIMEC